MSTFLSVMGFIFLLLIAAIVFGFFWVKTKARKGTALLAVVTLAAELELLKSRQSKPEHSGDAELNALISRAEEALDRSKDLMKADRFSESTALVVPILEETSALLRTWKNAAVDAEVVINGDSIGIKVTEHAPALNHEPAVVASQAKPEDVVGEHEGDKGPTTE